MSWFGPGYPIKKPEQSGGNMADKTEPKAAESFREDSKTAPSYVRVASASSSEFDEAMAQAEVKRLEELTEKDFLREHPQQDPLGGNYYDGMDNNKESEAFIDGARGQHARDAEEIRMLKAKITMMNLTRQMEIASNTKTFMSGTQVFEENQKLTEENQRLRDDLAHANETCKTFSDENAEWKLRVEKLEKEIIRLNRVILKELTENDELGCEYTYVNALRESNRKLTAALEDISEHRVSLDKTDLIHSVEGMQTTAREALAADGGAE